MYKINNRLIPIMTLLILANLANLSTSPAMGQTTGDEAEEKTEESAQTEKPFFFSYLTLNCLHLT